MKTVLVVDDSAAQREMIEELLQASGIAEYNQTITTKLG